MNEDEMLQLRNIFDAVETGDTAEICSEYADLTAIDDRYERKELIGEGGMKKVWRVYDRRTRATLAYAEPRDGLHPVFYDTMLEEAWRTASLSHPNIIKIHDTGTDGFPFFTMDLKYGDTLKEWKMRCNPSLDECLDVFLKVCDAMIHAHSRSVLHLDLKPDNIQIEGLNEVVVCDWGSGDGEGATPGYMAPEQSDVKNSKDQRTDIYGLGAVLYFLLTGESSAKGETAQKVIANTTIGIELPRYRFPELRVPRALNQIVARAMAVEPKQRYGSVKELCDDIIRFRNLRPTSGQERKLFTCGMLFYVRNQFSSNLAALCGFALILGGGWGIRKIEQYNKERQAEKARAEQAEQIAQTATVELQQVQKSIDKLVKNHDTAQRSISTQLDTVAETLKNEAIYRQPLETVRMLEQLATLSIKYNPDSILAWHERAEVLFLKLDFPKVREVISRRKAFLPTVWDAFSELPNKSYWSDKNKPFEAILGNWKENRQGTRQLLASRLLVYWRARKELSYEDAVRIFLKWADPAVTDITFSYDYHTLELGVVVKSRVTGNILQIFECEKLVLSGNWPLELSNFYQCGARELDISNRSVKDSMKSLGRFTKLQLLTVKKGVYSPGTLKILRTRMKVVEVP